MFLHPLARAKYHKPIVQREGEEWRTPTLLSPQTFNSAANLGPWPRKASQGHAISSSSRTQRGDRLVVRETQVRNEAVRVSRGALFRGWKREISCEKRELLIGKRFEGSPILLVSSSQVPSKRNKCERVHGEGERARGKETAFPFHYGKRGGHGWPLEETPLVELNGLRHKIER